MHRQAPPCCKAAQRKSNKFNYIYVNFLLRRVIKFDVKKVRTNYNLERSERVQIGLRCVDSKKVKMMYNLEQGLTIIKFCHKTLLTFR